MFREGQQVWKCYHKYGIGSVQGVTQNTVSFQCGREER